MAKTEIIPQPFAIYNAFGNNACYSRLPDGVLLQWGQITGLEVNLTQETSGATFAQNYTLTFPVPFANNQYVLSGSFQYERGAAFPVATPYNGRTVDYAIVSLRDVVQRVGNDGRLLWFAIGRWK